MLFTPHPLGWLLSKKKITETSLVVQWLRPCSPSAGAAGGIPGQGTKIPHATCCSQNKTNLKNEKATQGDSRGTWGGHVTWCWWGASPVSDSLYRPILGAGLRLLTQTHAREEPRVKTQPSANGIATVRNQCCSGTPGGCFTEHPVRKSSQGRAWKLDRHLRKLCLPLPCPQECHLFAIIVPAPLSSYDLIPCCYLLFRAQSYYPSHWAGPDTLWFFWKSELSEVLFA